MVRNTSSGGIQGLLIRNLAQQNYLKFHRARKSHPPWCEFLQGLRSYSEINKMKVLGLLVKVPRKDLMFFLLFCVEVLKNKEDRSLGQKGLTSWYCVGCRAWGNNFSYAEDLQQNPSHSLKRMVKILSNKKSKLC